MGRTGRRTAAPPGGSLAAHRPGGRTAVSRRCGDPDLEERTNPSAREEQTRPPELAVELRRRLVQRDPEALEAFFDAYFDRIYGYVRSLVRHEQLAEDLTQDVFLHVHRAIETYDAERELRPWVFTIATNKVRDYWRSKRHRESQKELSVEEGGGDGLVGRDGRPETPMLDLEMGEQVRAAVEELPEGMRITVHLRAYEGLSFEAIGAILERNEVAVRKRYSRALDHLRGALGPAYRMHAEGSS